MLRLTKQADYGIGLLVHFAQEPNEIHNARDLSERSHVPLPMVTKILKILTRKGLLQSHRGVKGGYSLARDSEEITVADAIRALEGPIALTACIEGEPGECEQEGVCPVRGHIKIINDAIRRALSGIQLSSLTQPASRQIVSLASLQPAPLACNS